MYNTFIGDSKSSTAKSTPPVQRPVFARGTKLTKDDQLKDKLH